MFTETELRDALAHSAARADDLVPDEDRIQPLAPVGGWRRFAMPLLTAAMVAGTVVGVVVATAPGRSSERPAGRVPMTTAALLDLVHIGNTSRPVTMGIGETHGYRIVSAIAQNIPSGGSPQIDLIPAGDPYDADAIPRNHPVQIDGRTGYYGYIPINPGAVNDEGAPNLWAVAFQNERGDWVLASVENASPSGSGYADPAKRTKRDPAAIVSAYEDLDVSFASGRNRVAYRFGWLPRGASITSAGPADFYEPEVGFSKVYLSYRDKYGSSITVTRPDAPEADPAQCGGSAQNQYALVCVQPGIFTDHVARELPQRILDDLTVVPPSQDASTYFTMAKAFGHIDHRIQTFATVQNVQVVDSGSRLQVVWSGTRGQTYVVVLAPAGGKPQLGEPQTSRRATINVQPDTKYCLLVQATNGTQVVESDPYALRGAKCSR